MQLSLGFKKHFSPAQMSPEQAGDAHLAVRTAEIDLLPMPHDLRLWFPLAYGEAGAELWTSAQFLSDLSPYWQHLLSSEFPAAERVNPKKRLRSEAVPAIATDVTDPVDDGFEDSDVEAESDETANASANGSVAGQGADGDRAINAPIHTPARPGQRAPPVDFEHRQVTIKSTRFPTYRAVLLYLRTGYIDFADLDAPAATRQEPVQAGLPARVSPRSVYRLAHLLGLEELQTRALDALRRRLTPHNAPGNLFSATSTAYPDYNQVVLQYVTQMWSAVNLTAEWMTVTDEVAKDEIPGAAAILVRVLRAVA
ncbi:hypothetical protein JCM3774_005714 [Rhodotorula dairenensis]